MSRLVPDKRLDRNGHWVTRHVRAADAPAPLIPSPSSHSFVAEDPARGMRSMTVNCWHASPSEALVKASGLGTLTSYSFEATRAQVYDVCGAVSRAMDAALLLAAGVRTADEAREYAQRVGTESLLGDGLAEAIGLACDRGVSVERFLAHYDACAHGASGPAAAVDAVRFRILVAGDTNYALDEIASGIATGKTSYDDVEEVHIWHLRKEASAALLAKVLPVISSGDAPCDVGAVNDVLDAAADEDLDFNRYYDLAEILSSADMSGFPEGASLEYLCRAYGQYRHGDWAVGRFDEGQAAERAVYFAQVWPRRPDLGRAELVNGFFEAGVPADIAVEVMRAGGTPQQAVAIRDGDVHRGLSSGAL